MINSDPDYCGVLLCGSENQRSVGTTEVFEQLVLTLASVFKVHSIRVKCRGRMTGHLGKNLAPRAGLFSERMLEEWKRHLVSNGFESFRRFELFGPNWTNQQAPMIYAAVDKLPRVMPNRSPEQDHAGAGNSVVLAIHKKILKFSTPEIEIIVKQLLQLTSGFYGYLNASDAWDYGSEFGAGRG